MKITSTIFLVLLLITACGSNNVSHNKNANTTTPETTAKVITPLEKTKTTAKELTKTKISAKNEEKTKNSTAESVQKKIKKEQFEEKTVKEIIKEEKAKKETSKMEMKKVSPRRPMPTSSSEKDFKSGGKDVVTPRTPRKPSNVKNPSQINPASTTTAINHSAWDQLLRKHVSSTGKVNYKAFKTAEQTLDAYLAFLDENPVQAAWSKGDKMAYWINAYNAFTIKLILKNYPTSSITNLHSGKAWDVKWIKLGGKTYSLNNIENDILRPKYKDARIHFAVNCAAKSCPPLLNRAWTAKKLNSYFEKQAKNFVNNAKYNKISANKVEISKIFEWYAVDFGNIIDFLNKYSSTKVNANAKVSYLEYDWKLNE